MSKFREIPIRPHVKLPALSVDIEERDYSMLSFLGEWVLGSEGMRQKDENLAHLFEWEEALEAFTKKMAAKAGIMEPKMPAKPPMPEQPKPGASEADKNGYNMAVGLLQEKMREEAKRYNEELEEYTKAVHAAAVDECLYLTDDAFKAGKEAAKAMLKERSTPNQLGQTQLPRPYEQKILRLYHALNQAKAIEEKDVPKKVTAEAVPN